MYGNPVEQDMCYKNIRSINVAHTKELTHISLCAGYGGIDLGLQLALEKIRTISFVEIEAFAIQNLAAKIEQGFLDTAPIFTDLKQFPWRKFARRVDILSGGFPCQPFSTAGNKNTDDDPRHLWPFIVQGIQELEKPPIVFFENVEGILTSQLKSSKWADPIGTNVLHHVLRELERLGYRATAGIFSASEVGATHQRKRLFILGVYSKLSDEQTAFVSDLLCKSAIEHPIELGDSHNSRDFAQEHDIDSHREETKQRWEERPQSESSRSSDFGLDKISILRSLRKRHQAFPAPRGWEQFSWEPPRVEKLGNSNNKGLERCRSEEATETHERRHTETEPTPSTSTRYGELQWSSEPSMGGADHGSSNRLGQTEFYTTCDSRTDELRLLGNGVVPQCAEKAFRHLWSRIHGS